MNYTNHFSTKETNQQSPIPGKTMVKNTAGGFSFAVSAMQQLDRFLILGSEGGTYYISENKLTVDNAQNIIDLIKKDGPLVVQRIVEISTSGRAPKNDPAIFALALCSSFGNKETKAASYAAIPSVCRIGTHLFQFCENVQNLRGWSSGLRRGVSSFYTSKNTDSLAYQFIKYQQRNGWTHRDVLRLAHTSPKDEKMNSLFQYVVGKNVDAELHPQIKAFEDLKSLDRKNVKMAAEIIGSAKLPREAVPTEFLREIGVWEALLADMPLTAMIRNLGKMTNVGLLTSNFDSTVKFVCQKLTNKEYLKKSRIHPLNLLISMLTYQNGHGEKGKLSWTPVRKIVESLDEAFYSSFEFVEPTGKNHFLAVDVSGSMTSPMSNLPLTYSQAAAAMAMVAVKTEENTEIMGFDTGMKAFKIMKNDSFAMAAKILDGYNGGGTDCSMPMVYALHKKIPVDTFVIYTDNETYAGKIHPSQALDEYRQKMGIPAKLIVVGMGANPFTIADPEDSGMLDIVGFDTSVPSVMAGFSRN